MLLAPATSLSQIWTDDLHVGARLSFLYLNTMWDLLFHGFDVGHQPDESAVVLEGVEYPHHVVEGVGVQRSETFVYEQGIHGYTTGLCLDGIGQPECQSEGSHEGFAAGEG